MMSKGFTLIELSIVLVIVGLLISGVLVAQSMIGAANSNKIMRYISEYEIAINNFKTRYASLPGDSMFISPIGDGNGRIGATGIRPTTVSETVNAWNHLQASGFFPEGKQVTYIVGTSIEAGVNVPKLDGGLGAMLFTAEVSYNTMTDPTTYPHLSPKTALFIGEVDTNVTSVYPGGGDIIDGAVYFAIDNKLDDGNPATGNMLGFGDPCKNDTSFFCASPIAPVTCQVSKYCNIIYEMEVY